jgi:sterol desaturase/sphingolipid hydroxylase (fatty acid hydroxylase superfamily)
MPAIEPSPQRIRLFKSERLERLTLMPPEVFAGAWGLLLPLILWVGWSTAAPLPALGLFAGGVLFWTLFEYALHRYLFHLEVEQPLVKWLVFVIHGNHHRNPGDPLRDLMPLSVSLPVSALVWSTCVLLFGAPGTWVFLGFIVGYVAYDAVHYACHHSEMRGRMGSALKRHHMRHHHVDDTSNYAITAIFWDRVFGSRIGSLKR